MMYMYAHDYRKMVKIKMRKVKKVKINCIFRFDQVGHYLI